MTFDICPRTSRSSKFWQGYPAVTVYQIGTSKYQEVVLRAPVSHFFMFCQVAFISTWTFNIHHDDIVKLLY